ncbi:MAG: CoA pyrophosphatase [Deltaproteobacteria bacterium]|nr:CoA pyrophosphatase [Deltaproteobacteria bacterium]
MNLVEVIPRIRKALDGRSPRPLEEEGLIPAAVLMPLFAKNGETHVLFTRRTDRVKTHKGQVSFPGGLMEPRDKSLLAAALRETREEIGMDPRCVEILGRLDTAPTFSTPYAITPFVGVIPYPQPFRLNPHEVERLLDVPLNFFMDESHARVEMAPHQGKERPVYYYEYGEEVIWGATARILRNFMEVVFGLPAHQ